MKEQRILELKPIGVIHSPYHDREEMPCQGCWRKEICQVEVFKEFEEGLKDIDGTPLLDIKPYIPSIDEKTMDILDWGDRPKLCHLGRKKRLFFDAAQDYMAFRKGG